VNTRPGNESGYCGTQLCPAGFLCLRPSR
jgi:hypothetical protein